MFCLTAFLTSFSWHRSPLDHFAMWCWVSEEHWCSENRFNLFSQASSAWGKCKVALFQTTSTSPSLSPSPPSFHHSLLHRKCSSFQLHCSFYPSLHLSFCLHPPIMPLSILVCLSLALFLVVSCHTSPFSDTPDIASFVFPHPSIILFLCLNHCLHPSLCICFSILVLVR